jgi:hypothetical protein
VRPCTWRGPEHDRSLASRWPAPRKLPGHDLHDALAAAADDQLVMVILRPEGNGKVGTAIQAATAKLARDLDEDAAPAGTLWARRQSQVGWASGRGALGELRRSWHADVLDSWG